MSEKITSLKKERVSQSAVRLLEDLLERAKKGEFSRFSYILHLPPDQVELAWSAECLNVPWGMLGCMQHLVETFRESAILPLTEIKEDEPS